MPLFDPLPKTKREDLYNREEELEKLLNLYSKEKIILILGVRRLGKSSLLNVSLNISKYPHIKIDASLIYGEYGIITKANLANSLQESLNSQKRIKWFAKIGNFLATHIEGISFGKLEIRIRRDGKMPSIVKIIEAINKWAEKEKTRFIIAFDEAQYLRFSNIRLPLLIRGIIEKTNNLVFVLTGSEVGLLYDFLGIYNPKGAFFGRHIEEVYLKRFSEKESYDFLVKGFKQYKVKPANSIIKKAVATLDGIVGWLTLFGYRCVKEGYKGTTLNDFLEQASLLVANELSKIIFRSARYKYILKAIAYGYNRWVNIKEYVEQHTGSITNARFSNLLKTLEKVGYVEKKKEMYHLPDEIVRYTVLNKI